MAHGWPSEDNFLELVLSFDCGLLALNPSLQACAEAPLPRAMSLAWNTSYPGLEYGSLLTSFGWNHLARQSSLYLSVPLPFDAMSTLAISPLTTLFSPTL